MLHRIGPSSTGRLTLTEFNATRVVQQRCGYIACFANAALRRSPSYGFTASSTPVAPTIQSSTASRPE